MWDVIETLVDAVALLFGMRLQARVWSVTCEYKRDQC